MSKIPTPSLLTSTMIEVVEKFVLPGDVVEEFILPVEEVVVVRFVLPVEPVVEMEGEVVETFVPPVVDSMRLLTTKCKRDGVAGRLRLPGTTYKTENPFVPF